MTARQLPATGLPRFDDSVRKPSKQQLYCETGRKDNSLNSANATVVPPTNLRSLWLSLFDAGQSRDHTGLCSVARETAPILSELGTLMLFNT